MKQCRSCQGVKPLTDYNKKAGTKDNHRGDCRDCQKAEHKARYAADPDKHKARSKENQRAYTVKKMGLSMDDLAKMYDKTDGRCYICGTKEEADGKYLAIDHCHKSGNVRGLLCMPCNTGLGNFKDNVQTLRNAIKYLEV